MVPVSPTVRQSHQLLVRSHFCAAVLQDDGVQGELVATLLALAEAIAGAGLRKGLFKQGPADIALAEKALKLVESCLTGSRRDPPHLRLCMLCRLPQ